MRDFDEEIKRAIEQHTEKSADQSDAVWDQLKQQLEEHKMPKTRRSQKKKRPFKAGGLVAAAIAALIIFTAFTPIGTAAFQSVIELFAPEKEIVTTIEGQEETDVQDVHVGPTPSAETTTEPQSQTATMTYVMYIDESRYTVETANGVDKIVPVDYPADYPEVSMVIEQIENQSPDVVAQSIKSTLADSFPTVSDIETITSPLDALLVSAVGAEQNEIQWDTPEKRVYLVDNTQGGAFKITVTFFVEAEEGHGARYEQMLEEFTVVKLEE